MRAGAGPGDLPLGAAQQAAPGKPRRRDAEDLDRRQAVAEAAAAAVGDQDHAPAAGDEGAQILALRNRLAAAEDELLAMEQERARLNDALLGLGKAG